MELDKFITGTITAIIKGIKDSQDYAKDNYAVVSPYLHLIHREKNNAMVAFDEQGKDPRAISQLRFDIAVTATEESAKSGHGGINVMSLKLGGELANKDSNQTVSRVQF